jgi:hypothetical protein
MNTNDQNKSAQPNDNNKSAQQIQPGITKQGEQQQKQGEQQAAKPDAHKTTDASGTKPVGDISKS